MATHRRGPGGPQRSHGRYTPKVNRSSQLSAPIMPPSPEPDDKGGIDPTHDLHLPVQPPERLNFDRCPICLSTELLTAEHVPPAAVGGRAMTSTCSPCNNRLGSLIDRPFVDSMFGRFPSFKISTQESNGVPGFRTYKNTRLARGNGHDLAVWIDGTKNPNRAEALEGATGFATQMQLPDQKAAHLGELKNLYLACCVIAGEVLTGETAERVRNDLVAVRDEPTALTHRDTFDVTHWNRWIQPFDAEVTRPDSEPINQAVVARNARLIPAVAWLNYTCESPFEDSPRLSETLRAGCRSLEDWLRK